MPKSKEVSVWGVRRTRNRPAEDVIAEAVIAQRKLRLKEYKKYRSVAEIRADFIDPAKAYFSLAAMTRRKLVEDEHRQIGMNQLFTFRSLLERQIFRQLEKNVDELDLLRFASANAFFGCSIKQGVSVRYPLLTCAPTNKCGQGCYAHDGRDRALIQVFRGSLNYLLGSTYENGNSKERSDIRLKMQGALDFAVCEAEGDAARAQAEGFKRSPRIRLSHVGEMAATPEFTNMLAEEIKRRNRKIQCVIYTRHPSAEMFNRDLLVVNFTVEGANDPRWNYVKKGMRVVSSAWNGEIVENASVNFLEHHVEKSHEASGMGNICPVTIDHKTFPSCDSAKCIRCFKNTDA